MSRLPWVLAATAIAATPAAAQSKRVIAAVFLAKGDPDADILAALKAELPKAAVLSPEIDVLSQGELRMRLRNAGKGPLAEAAVLRCGSDLACIAELGRLAAAAEVLLVRVGPLESGAVGLTAQILVTDSQARQVTRRVKIDLTSVAEVAPLVARHRAEIYGVQAETAVETPVAAVATPAETASQVDASWWRNRAVFRYGGLGVAGAGGFCLAVGVISGLKASSAKGSIEAGTDQPRAAELSEEANSAARRANRFLLAGSALALIGGGLLGWEMFGMEHVTPTVEAGEGGAKAGILLTW